MSESWSIADVADWEELWVDATETGPSLFPLRETTDGRVQQLEPVTAVLIWALVAVHIAEITPENLEETFVRVRMLELASGPLLHRGSQPQFITLEDLRRRIGMRVVPGLATRSFEEGLVRALEEEARQALKREKSAP